MEEFLDTLFGQLAQIVCAYCSQTCCNICGRLVSKAIGCLVCHRRATVYKPESLMLHECGNQLSVVSENDREVFYDILRLSNPFPLNPACPDIPSFIVWNSHEDVFLICPGQPLHIRTTISRPTQPFSVNLVLQEVVLCDPESILVHMLWQVKLFLIIVLKHIVANAEFWYQKSSGVFYVRNEFHAILIHLHCTSEKIWIRCSFQCFLKTIKNCLQRLGDVVQTSIYAPIIRIQTYEWRLLHGVNQQIKYKLFIWVATLMFISTQLDLDRSFQSRLI